MSPKWIKVIAMSAALSSLTFSSRGAVQIVSGGYTGGSSAESHGDSFAPKISDDGRYVTFESLADDLTSDNPDSATDVFRYDRQTGAMLLVSDAKLKPYGQKAEIKLSSVSSDGQRVAYSTSAEILTTVPPVDVTVVRDLNSNSTVVLKEPEFPPDYIFPGSPTELCFAADAHRLFFATSLTSPPSDTGEFSRLQYFDLDAGSLTAINQPIPETYDRPIVQYLGANLNTSRDGRHLAFQFGATSISGLIRDEIFVFDNDTKSLDQISIHGAASVDTDTTGSSSKPAISNDGRWVVFESRSTNLVANDANGSFRDVYLHDRSSQTTTLVSTNSSGVSSTGSDSTSAVISEDGLWTVFFSDADDLVAGDNNQTADLFLRNNQTGELTRISTHPGWHGLMARTAVKPVVSPDGEWILYQASGSGVFLYQRSLGQSTLITSDCEEDVASMTPDGQFIAFTAKATTVNPSSSTSARNVYVWVRSSGQVELISRRDSSYNRLLPEGDSHLYAGGVSSDGTRYIFRSAARGLSANTPDEYESLWVRDLTLKTNILIAVNDGNYRKSGPRPFSEAVMSRNGRYVAYLAQRTNLPPEGLALNGWDDIFVRDLDTGLNQLVTSSRTGSFTGSSNSLHLSISNDGNRLAFTSDATNLSIEPGGPLGIYLWDRATDTLKRIDDPAVGSSGPTGIQEPEISPDGSHIAFISLLQGTSFYTFYTREWNDAQASSPVPAIEAAAFGWNATGNNLALIGRAGGVYVYDLVTHQTNTKAASVHFGNLGLSFDASLRFIACIEAYNLNNVGVRAWDDETGQLVEQTGFPSKGPLSAVGTTMSSDGRFIVFKTARPTSINDMLAEDRIHLLVFDRVNNTLNILDRSIIDGDVFDVPPGLFVMAPNVSRVLFESYQPDLVSRDDNLAMDIFAVDLVATDADQDGMDDAWEMAYFDTLDRDGSGDFDGDGISDLGEYQAGTVPINSDSVLSVTEIRNVNTGERLISWRSITGKRYRVQMKESVDASAWLDRSGVISATGETTSFSDSPDAGSELPPTRFYRVLLAE